MKPVSDLKSMAAFSKQVHVGGVICHTCTCSNCSWTCLLHSIACLLIPYMDPTHYTTACSSDNIHSVSTNMSLLPLSSISASSETSDDPVQDLVTGNSDAWCSVESFDSRPSATLNFTHPVALVNMIARGGVTGFSYVTNFSVEVFDETTDQFMTYSFSGDRIVRTCTLSNISCVIYVVHIYSYTGLHYNECSI